MNIVVTGALGHIGSRLVRSLPAAFANAEVLMIDNLATQRYASLFHLPEGRYRFVEGDVEKIPLEPLVAGADVVVHLAAITDATASLQRRETVETHNLAATRAVGEACAQTGTPLIFPSSTSVYGPQTEFPPTESIDEHCSETELRPQSPYAETKLREECLLRELGERAGLRFSILRCGTIFGPSPGMRFHTAVNKFCWQAAFGQPLTVWRTALGQRRPYLDISDACRAMEFVIGRGLFDGQTYNVLTLNATVGDIIEVLRCFVPNLKIELVEHPLMNQLSYTVSNELFRRTGFEFSGDLHASVLATIEQLRGVGGTTSSADPNGSRSIPG